MSSFEEFNQYHMETKHSYFSVRSFPNRLNWDNQPKVFKTYPDSFEKKNLDVNLENHSFIYYIAGITAKKSYPGVEYYLRVNPSAGALYPNEIYFQSRNNENLEDGIYHFDIANSSITLLQKIKDDGIEPLLGYETQQDGFLFLISSVYYRSSWKYKNRAFRYCLLDAGHILGTIEMSTYVHDKEYEIVYNFDKKASNILFNFDEKEFFTVAVRLAKSNNKQVQMVKLDLPTVDGSYYFETNELIQEAYESSLSLKNCKEEDKKPNFNYQKEFLKEIILKRRSIREFTKQAISKKEFETILDVLNQAITSDCDEMIDIYYVVNRVKELKPGLYKNEELLKKGDLSSKAGYLCLEQDLGTSSAVTFFLTSKGKNYQELYQKAGIIGHRLYISSNYLGYGCSGIGAYYDDEVCEFVGDNTQVLYALAIGN
ncbi:MAG: SagB family peptide dehydrogenase [Halarcobacter sp.]